MKYLIIFLIVGQGYGLMAQSIPQGTRFLGGNVSFSTTSNTTTPKTSSGKASTSSSSSLGISPSLTLFNKDNVAMMYSITYSSSGAISESAISNGISSSGSLGIGAGIKRYTMLDDKFGFYYGFSGGLSVGLNNNKAFSINAYPLNVGVIYLFNEKFALEGGSNVFNVGITTDTSESSVSKTNSFSFRVGTGLGIGFGLRYSL